MISKYISLAAASALAATALNAQVFVNGYDFSDISIDFTDSTLTSNKVGPAGQISTVNFGSLQVGGGQTDQVNATIGSAPALGTVAFNQGFSSQTGTPAGLAFEDNIAGATVDFNIDTTFITGLDLSFDHFVTDPSGALAGTHDVAYSTGGGFTSVGTFTPGSSYAKSTFDFGDFLDGAGDATIRITFDSGITDVSGDGLFGAAGNNDVIGIDNVVFTATEVIPEPSTYMLLGLGLGAVLVFLRKRRA